jgi:hypothetical protein
MSNETELNVDPIQLFEDISLTAISDCLNIQANESVKFRDFRQHLIDEKFLSRLEGQSCINTGDLIGLVNTR